MKDTYYIVQSFGGRYASLDRPSGIVGWCLARDKATHLTLAEARRIYNAERRDAANAYDLRHGARRFPRIIKVAVETKTITDRR